MYRSTESGVLRMREGKSNAEPAGGTASIMSADWGVVLVNSYKEQKTLQLFSSTIPPRRGGEQKKEAKNLLSEARFWW